MVLPVKWVAPNFYHGFANMLGRDFCFQNERIATTGRVLQPAALKQEAWRSRQCRGEGGAVAGSAVTRGCLAG